MNSKSRNAVIVLACLAVIVVVAVGIFINTELSKPSYFDLAAQKASERQEFLNTQYKSWDREGLKIAPVNGEGYNGGLFDTYWMVKERITSVDNKNNVIEVSLIEANGYDKYLLDMVYIDRESIKANNDGHTVDNTVKISFLPNTNNEVICHAVLEAI